MKQDFFNRYPCFVDEYGESFIFGIGGYVRATPGRIIAHILKDSYKLSTKDFSERGVGPQELPVTEAGLKGILEHLKANRAHKLQIRLKTFLDFELAAKNINKINSVERAKIQNTNAPVLYPVDALLHNKE